MDEKMMDEVKDYPPYLDYPLKRPRPDLTELDKLEAYLKAKGILYLRRDEIILLGRYHMEQHQIVVFADDGRRMWDAVCQRGSYGYEEGLLEVMGKPVVRKSDGDDVVGWLTAADVIARLEGAP